jgi:F-type H+-transporting ATPase subunit b
MPSTRVFFGLLVALAVVTLTVGAWDMPALGADQSVGTADQQPQQHSPGAPRDHDPPEDGQPSHDAGGHGSGGINPVAWEEVQGDLAIWTGVVFLLLLAVLWKFAWGPIRSGLEQREQGIASQISQAEESNQKARELLGLYEQKLAASKDEVRGILDSARRDAEQLGREVLGRAKEEADAERQRALEQIDAATAEALTELARRSSALAVQLAGKILRTELKPEDHARMVQQAVTDFQQKRPGNGVSSR